jgi:hypothetical protein
MLKQDRFFLHASNGFKRMSGHFVHPLSRGGHNPVKVSKIVLFRLEENLGTVIEEYSGVSIG